MISLKRLIILRSYIAPAAKRVNDFPKLFKGGTVYFISFIFSLFQRTHFGDRRSHAPTVHLQVSVGCKVFKMYIHILCICFINSLRRMKKKSFQFCDSNFKRVTFEISFRSTLDIVHFFQYFRCFFFQFFVISIMCLTIFICNS